MLQGVIQNPHLPKFNLTLTKMLKIFEEACEHVSKGDWENSGIEPLN